MQKVPTVHTQLPSGCRKWLHWLFLALLLCMALLIRLDDLLAWRQLPQKAFLNDRPLLISFDGYFYLSLARDLQNKTYESRDHLRGVPDTIHRPTPPPLISLMAATVSTITGVSLEWIGVLLPPLLGVLLAVPLYLFGRLYGGSLMALVTTFVGLCSGYYVYRTNLGWFDTDCMNVTFALLVSYLFLQFGLKADLRRYAYLAGGGVATLLFLVWWDQATAPVVVISLSPLLIAAALFYRPKGRELWIAVGVAVLLAAGLMAWQGPQLFGALYKKSMGLLGYIAKEQTGAFPNIGSSVFEQKPLDFDDLVNKTTGNPVVFFSGVIGLGWLCWARRRAVAPLVVLFTLGCFSFLFARRFLIFLNPFLALGVGYLTQKCWDLRHRWPPLRWATPIIVALVCLPTIRNNVGTVYWPKETPPITEGIQSLATLSPQSSIVWAWWDHGYPIVYWGQRATINDGSVHSGLRTVCNAIPLTASDPRYSAAFMHFYVARGTQGLQSLFDALGSPGQGMALIRQVLAAGPQQADSLISRAGLKPLEHWRDFFFPQTSRPLYLFLDLRLARTTYWWHWFGTWDTESRSGRHAKFKLIRGLNRQGDHIRGPDIDVDLGKGIITVQQYDYPLASLITKDGALLSQRVYDTSNGVDVVFRKEEGVGAIMEPAFSGTLFNQLFLLADSQWPGFTRVAQRYPYYQIWKVASPDRIFQNQPATHSLPPQVSNGQ